MTHTRKLSRRINRPGENFLNSTAQSERDNALNKPPLKTPQTRANSPLQNAYLVIPPSFTLNHPITQIKRRRANNSVNQPSPESRGPVVIFTSELPRTMGCWAAAAENYLRSRLLPSGHRCSLSLSLTHSLVWLASAAVAERGQRPTIRNPMTARERVSRGPDAI